MKSKNSSDREKCRPLDRGPITPAAALLGQIVPPQSAVHSIRGVWAVAVDMKVTEALQAARGGCWSLMFVQIVYFSIEHVCFLLDRDFDSRFRARSL